MQVLMWPWMVSGHAEICGSCCMMASRFENNISGHQHKENLMTDSRKALREQGLKIRTEVLGKKYVEAALNNVNAFNGGLQDLLNEYCWGAGWGGEGLTRKERSLLN